MCGYHGRTSGAWRSQLQDRRDLGRRQLCLLDYQGGHPLKIRGKVRYEGEGDVQIGYYFRNLEKDAGSLVRQGVKVKDLEQGWQQWECSDPGLLKLAPEMRLQAVGIIVKSPALRDRPPLDSNRGQ